MSDTNHNRLPGDSRGLARNTLLNVVGLAAPLAAALFAIPLLIRGLGEALFGVLGIAWVVVGYFSLFDMGIGRALTQGLAEKLGQGETQDVPGLIWTGLALMLVLGAVGGLILAVLSPWLVHDVLAGIPTDARQDCLQAFYVLAATIPFVVSTSGLRGVLEAVQRFDLVNAVRIPLGVFTFAGPLLVLPFSPTITAVVLVLLGGRIVAWAVHVLYCFRVFPGLAQEVTFQRRLAGPLVRFGGWVTLSNVISPLMIYADRFLIGVIVSVAAVTYYVTPWEVATRLLLIPSALSAVLLPAFSSGRHRDERQVEDLYFSGIKFVAVALVPAALLVVLFAEEGLRLWIGPDMAVRGYRIMQILTIGVVFNGVAHVPFMLIQGLGRADLTAKLHVLELFVYGGVLWLLTASLGLVGVAVAWLLRALLDMALLLWTGRRLLRADAREYVRTLSGIGIGFLLLVLAMLPASPAAKGTAFVVMAGCYLGLAWRYVLAARDRHTIKLHVSRYLRWA